MPPMDSTQVLLAKVDATKEGNLARKYNITGFPIVKLFEGTKMLGNYQALLPHRLEKPRAR